MAKLPRRPDPERLRTTEPSLTKVASGQLEPSPIASETRFHRALADPLMHRVLTGIVDEIGYGLI